jgi:hypothetical protein
MKRGPDNTEIKAVIAAISHACHGHHMGEAIIALAHVAGNMLSKIKSPSKRKKALMVFTSVVNEAMKDDQEEETLQ